MLCSLDGYPEKKGTGMNEMWCAMCSLDGYPEKKGTGVEEDDYVVWGLTDCTCPKTNWLVEFNNNVDAEKNLYPIKDNSR